MRCLVTGVAGFVGSHLAERLLADGHEVCGIDAFIDYYPRAIKENNIADIRSWNRFTLIEGDLLLLNLDHLLEGIEVIFHQAAQAGVRASWGREFQRYTDCNILATQRLLEAAVHTKTLLRFVFASSSSVYGNSNVLPVTENVIPQPVSPYGVSKLAAEHLCTLYYRNFGVPTVSLRYFTVYGPRQRPDMAFNRFCNAIARHQSIHIFGDGTQTRDFTYIADIVEANILAASSPNAAGEVMNIAGGSRVTMLEVVETLREISGSEVDAVFENKQRGDVDHTFADTHLAEQVLGYHPRVVLHEGLTKEFEYFKAVHQEIKNSVH